MDTAARTSAPRWGGLRPQFDELHATLQLVTDTIVESLGFDVAVINIVFDESAMVVAAVTGPDEVHEALMHRRQGLEGWTRLLTASEPWGRLRFLDHLKSSLEPEDVFQWTPDLPISDDPEAWHPEDSLFAPLVSTDGLLIGVLSVDCPRDGRRPGPMTRTALEAAAVTASLAIQHAALAAESRRNGAQLQAVFDDSPVPIALLDESGALTRTNAALCAFLGRTAEDLTGRHLDELTLAARSAPASLFDDGTGDRPDEHRFALPDGRIVWGRLHLVPLEASADGAAGSAIAQIEDITERKVAQARLVRQAHYDALTGLPNRAQSMRQLRDVLGRDALSGGTSAVFFCDLDRLKLINDGHGHAVGDVYIREVGHRIRASVRDGDVVGRLSGDEFVVIVQEVAAITEVAELANRVVDAVRAPLHLGGVTLSPSISIGVACSVGGMIGADELLARADSAMYRAKVEDRGSWHLDDPLTHSSAAEQVALRSEVAAALSLGQFVLHYQPIVSLADGDVRCHEALLRWQHPTRGLLQPAQFLDVVLDSEFETPVTDWVIRRACLDASRRPPGRRSVSVNVSSLQVCRHDLPDVVARALAAAGPDAPELHLEVTEDRLLSRPEAPELLGRLRGAGARIVIDDFGMGYAGLRYLQLFPDVSVVKLDRSFVAPLGDDRRSESIVRAVVGLAADVGVQLVTEGVETPEQATRLTALGVELAQGYLFGRPRAFDPAVDAAVPVAH